MALWRASDGSFVAMALLAAMALWLVSGGSLWLSCCDGSFAAMALVAMALLLAMALGFMSDGCFLSNGFVWRVQWLCLQWLLLLSVEAVVCF